MSNVIEKVRERGYAVVDSFPQSAKLLRERLMGSMAFTGHVIPQGDRVPRLYHDAIAQPHGFACHKMRDALMAPGIFDIIASYHQAAADYFQEEPLLYSVNAFWKKSSGAPGWHHDTDDGDNQLVMFMYGTDVFNSDDGVHCYVPTTHKWPREDLRSHHNVQEDVSGPLPSDWPVHTILGEAGTTFLSDTRGLHNGFPPADGKPPRLLLWARWSTHEPKSYKNDEIIPVPWKEIMTEKPSVEIRRRTRLVVDWMGA